MEGFYFLEKSDILGDYLNKRVQDSLSMPYCQICQNGVGI